MAVRADSDINVSGFGGDQEVLAFVAVIPVQPDRAHPVLLALEFEFVVADVDRIDVFGFLMADGHQEDGQQLHELGVPFRGVGLEVVVLGRGDLAEVAGGLEDQVAEDVAVRGALHGGGGLRQEGGLLDHVAVFGDGEIQQFALAKAGECREDGDLVVEVFDDVAAVRVAWRGGLDVEVEPDRELVVGVDHYRMTEKE